MIRIYTDGACSSKDNIGGWGVFIEDGSMTKYLSGYKQDTTNNEMELTAVVQAIEYIRKFDMENEPIEFYSDSAYITNCFKDKWYEKWEVNGWKTSKREEVKHKQLWQIIISFFKTKSNASISWIKGHSDTRGNIIADELATEALSDLRKSLEVK